MTLVLALRCSDGIVMAADGRAVSTDNFAFNVRKIEPVSDTVLWGASGSAAVMADVHKVLSADPGCFTDAGVQQRLRRLVHPVLTEHYDSFIEKVPGVSNTPSPSTVCLLAGYMGGEARILEVDQHCQVTDYSATGFHAIGSGALAAQVGNALLTHFRPQEKPHGYGLRVAYRVIDTVVRVSGSGVGPPVSLWTSDETEIREVDEAAVRAVRDDVGGWQELEEETLDRMMGARDGVGSPIPAEHVPEL